MRFLCVVAAVPQRILRCGLLYLNVSRSPQIVVSAHGIKQVHVLGKRVPKDLDSGLRSTTWVEQQRLCVCQMPQQNQPIA